MSRESRLIAILAVIAVIGVSGLMMVADQYRKAIANAEIEDAPARAERLVAGFLAARQAVIAVVARNPGTIEDPSSGAAAALRGERLSALAAHGMTFADYVAVRDAWRTFRSGGTVDDPALVAAFEARRVELDDAASGAVEGVDEAIR
jgi:hypothetical protein